ncbi:MAG: hypothetical protein LBU58_12410 [Clostridiales bacterium]|jgi:hypothetical protein|nr:hypothetical protein [Clostridiales bacterium]
MSIPKHKEPLYKAIDQYIAEHELQTDFETIRGLGGGRNILPYADYAVFDPPPGARPEPGTPGSDGPEYRGKLVLIARLQPDGSITVEETEHTDKYMRVHKQRSA